RAGDDLEVMRRPAGLRLGHEVEPRVTGRERLHLRIRDADQDNGLGMLHKLHTDDLRGVIDGDQRMDRLAGIARGRDEIGRREDPADRILPLQDGRDGLIRADGSVAVGPRNEDIGGNLRNVFGENRFGAKRQGEKEAERERQEYGREELHRATSFFARRSCVTSRYPTGGWSGAARTDGTLASPAAAAGRWVTSAVQSGGPRVCGRGM